MRGLWCLALVSLCTAASITDHSIPLAKHRRKIPAGHRKPSHAIFGSVYDTYITILNVGGQDFTVVLDTGSSDTSIPVGPQSGCPNYYNGKCTGPYLEVLYDEGNWTGHACKGPEVKLGHYSAGHYVFAGMETQFEMLECSGPSVIGHERTEGIIGLAYQPIIGPPVDYSVPLFEAIVAKNNIPNLFAFQSCGWDGCDVNDPIAKGHLDIGRVKDEHYYGPIHYSPITKREYYNIQIIDVRVGATTVMPTYRHSNITEAWKVDNGRFLHTDDPNCIPMPDSIIDSGTSAVSLTTDIFQTLLAEIKRQVPGLPQDFWVANGGDARCVSAEVAAKFPDVSFDLIGEQPGETLTINLPACRYLLAADKDEGNDCPGFLFQLDEGPMEDGNILGSVVYEALYVVHDNTKLPNRVGFANVAGCKTPHLCKHLQTEASTYLTKQVSKKAEVRKSAVLMEVNAEAAAGAGAAAGVGVGVGVPVHQLPVQPQYPTQQTPHTLMLVLLMAAIAVGAFGMVWNQRKRIAGAASFARARLTGYQAIN